MNNIIKYTFIFILAASGHMTSTAAEPNILVTQSGETLKVYNLDVTSSDNIYYSLSDKDNAPLKKIQKNNQL